MRRLSTVGLLLVSLAVLLGVADPASAARNVPAQGGKNPGTVIIAKVSGLIDPVVADFIERSIDDAEREGAVALVLRIDSPGAVVSDARVARIARRMHDATVPVTAWVGPSGSKAYGAAAQLVGASSKIGIAPGAHLGKTGDLVVPESLLQPGFRARLGKLQDGRVGDAEARKLGIVPKQDARVIGEFVIGLEGVETKVVGKGQDRRLQTVTVPRFTALPVQDQLLHTVASPAVAYLLFVMGLALLVFELFTAGVGVAGVVGAGCFILSCYGLAVLPTRPLGVFFLVLGIFGFAVDIQTGVPRVWTGIGVVSLAIGSLFLYDGPSLSWITLLAGIGGVSLAMIAGMPAMVRTRFSTPTIGREWMIGESGEAVADVSPDGVVRIRGALWRARTNRATPIAAGEAIKVVEVEGLLLEVEPAEGGAVDYREKRRSDAAGDVAPVEVDGVSLGRPADAPEPD